MKVECGLSSAKGWVSNFTIGWWFSAGSGGVWLPKVSSFCCTTGMTLTWGLFSLWLWSSWFAELNFRTNATKKDSAHDYPKTNSRGVGNGAIEIYATWRFCSVWWDYVSKLQNLLNIFGFLGDLPLRAFPAKKGNNSSEEWTHRVPSDQLRLAPSSGN